MDQDLEIGYTSQLIDSSARLDDSCSVFVRRNELGPSRYEFRWYFSGGDCSMISAKN